MNKKYGLILVLALVLVLSVVGITQAHHEPVGGERINVLHGLPTTYPAGEPFHIWHGFGVIPLDDFQAIGVFRFELELDGEPVESDGPIHIISDTNHQIRQWRFNFPDGLSGTHTFSGTWIKPCYRVFPDGREPNKATVGTEASLTLDFN